MAIIDISNLDIEDSFQGLVQVDTSSLEIGTALGTTLSNITVTASFATTASHALNVPASASFAISASQATSASFAQNSRNADIAVSASFSTNAVNATSASYALFAVSASHEITKEISSSYADVAGTAQSVAGGDVFGAVESASYAVVAETAGTANSASYVLGSNVNGAVANATNARYVNVQPNAINSNYFPSFTNGTGENTTIFIDTTGYTYNPANNKLTVENISATTLSGSLFGNATTATSASHAESSSLANRNLLTASNDFSEITFTKGDGSTFLIDATPRQVIETVKNADATTIGKGFPVYVSGSTGNALNVYKADASNPNRMPATFVLEQTLDPGEEGFGILNGFINGVSTIGFNDGDTVWVAAGGGYTNVKPTGSNLIQKLGNVVVGNSVNGSGIISTQQANDLPNITAGYAWVGNVNQVPTAVSTASLLVDNAVSASRAVSASNADSLKQGIDVILNSGSFNFISAETASIGYLQSITGSAKIIGDAFIILNNDTPTERYAGIIVQDSGSNNTASLQFDGQTNDWFYQYEGDDPTDFGVVMFGPEYATKGSPTYLSNNTIPKGNGGHHLNDSSITDDGSSVVIGNVATFTNGATGSLHGNVTGDLTGNASTATTASFALNAGSSLTAVSASYATTAGSAVSASFAEDARTADSATSSSFATSASISDISVSSSFATSASIATSAITASHIVSPLEQSLVITGSVNGNVVNASSFPGGTASLDCSQGNFFDLGSLPLSGTATPIHIVATNIQKGQTINVVATQATGEFNSLTWEGQFKFPGGIEPQMTLTASAVDVFSFVSFDTASLFGTSVQNMS